ncbi:MAG: polysaccharide biosynthesis tyrosine autokinase [Flavobacterium sp.]|nr:MAG: polysaccharide biosynthesis tyrosine autokinase [Flavobacterium sp.]
MLDNKIHSRQDVEKLTTIPYLGDVPLSDENKETTFDSRSSTAESFRIILTNLEFMLGNTQPGKAKTIFITSTMPREGKTFVSVNLAKTLALYGKKVILMGMDLRHPKFSEYLDVNTETGISNFLSSDKYKLEDVMFKQKEFNDLWIMPSGAIPPNPAELLNNNKVGELFDRLKTDFDYIIVDTAPVSLVTDTLLLKNYADVFVYAVRANYLRKNALMIPESLHKENKLPNMSILLNGVDHAKAYGYGYGYGYAYGYGYGQQEKKPTWFDKILKK